MQLALKLHPCRGSHSAPSAAARLRAEKSRYYLPVTYQNQVLSRPGCSIGISLASFYSHSFFPGTRISLIGINPDGEDVLACRQVAVVVSALTKASYVLAIDGQDDEEIGPKICHPVNQQMT